MDFVQVLIQGDWSRLRILAVDVTGSRNQLVLPRSCDAMAVAHDGVFRQLAPHTANVQNYSLPGGSRLDLALKCNVEGMYNVTFAGEVVAAFNVSAGTVSSATPYAGGTSQWVPFRPPYLADMRSRVANSTFTMTVGTDNINGKEYDPLTPLRDISYSSVEEWTLKSSMTMPIRTSTFAMQVVACPGYDSGEFYDHIVATTASDCTVRLRVLNFSGKFVAQASNFKDAQQGAKSWFRVSPGGFKASTSDIDQKGCS
jgi:FtsP/CotA-like multicopper oxidase with cupredoxin domain